MALGMALVVRLMLHTRPWTNYCGSPGAGGGLLTSLSLFYTRTEFNNDEAGG